MLLDCAQAEKLSPPRQNQLSKHPPCGLLLQDCHLWSQHLLPGSQLAEYHGQLVQKLVLLLQLALAQPYFPHLPAHGSLQDLCHLGQGRQVTGSHSPLLGLCMLWLHPVLQVLAVWQGQAQPAAAEAWT